MFSWWEPSLRSGNFGHLCSLCKLSLSVSLSISQHQHLCILYEPAPGTSKSWPVWQVSSVVCQFQVRNFFRFFSIDQFTDLTNDQGHQGQTMQTANCSVYVGNSANWLPQLPKLPEKLCLGMDSLKFTCISLHFIAFHCISMHFIAFHCISLHFIASPYVCVWCSSWILISSPTEAFRASPVLMPACMECKMSGCTSWTHYYSIPDLRITGMMWSRAFFQATLQRPTWLVVYHKWSMTTCFGHATSPKTTCRSDGNKIVLCKKVRHNETLHDSAQPLPSIV